MGISTNCGLIIGLPYDEFVAALPEGENSIDEFNEMIDQGGLDVGSIYYDSPRDENIVGKWLTKPSCTREIKPDTEDKVFEIGEELKEQFPDVEFKLYVTNCVW